MPNSRHTQTVSSIPESEVRAELDRILASRGFATAGRISKLLRYVVEKTLAGETDQLKEYAVGIEVFDRDDKYDPRVDSIVRVEAGRLRTKLDEYYNGEGASSNIRIGLPRGGYVATFGPAKAGPSQENSGPSHESITTSEGPTSSERPTGSEGPASAGPRLRPTSVLFAAVLLLAVGGMVFWLVQRSR